MRAFIDVRGRVLGLSNILTQRTLQVEKAEALANEWGCEKFTPRKSGRFITSDINPKMNIYSESAKVQIHKNLQSPTQEQNPPCIAKT